MKKIAIDARMVRHSGIGTLTTNIISRLPMNSGLDIFLLGNPDHLKTFGLPVIPCESPIYSLREQIDIPVLLKRNGIEALHSTHYNIPLFFRGKLCVSIHDLIHLIYPQFLSSKAALFYARLMFSFACKNSDKIITISEHSKRDIIKYFKTDPSRIAITYPGVSSDFFVSEEKARVMKEKYGRYILYVGAIRPHKNVLRLAEAFISLKQSQKLEHKLVLVGKSKTDYLIEIKRMFRENHLENALVIIENPPQGVIPDMYRGAELFVFPSLYEGFGLPPIEAMACGCPVVSSNSSSLPEVIGDAGLLIDPDKVEELASAMYKVLTEQDFRDSLIQKGFERIKRFSWETTTSQTFEIYKEMLL